MVKRFCDRVAIMYLGRIVEMAPAAQLFAAPRHPYTRALLEAVPRLERDPDRRRAALEGEPPSAARLSPGCVFSSRCPYAEPACREPIPGLEDDEHEHAVACLRRPEVAAIFAREDAMPEAPAEPAMAGLAD